VNHERQRIDTGPVDTGRARETRRPSVPRYAELRCHSCFSFLEGASHPEELVARAADLGLSALALTDVNGLYGIVRAHGEAKRRGFPLLVGAELVVTGLTPGRSARLVLLAQDREGYAGLCRLATRAHVIAPDLRGHGDTDWIGAGGYYHFLDYVADLDELIARTKPCQPTRARLPVLP